MCELIIAPVSALQQGGWLSCTSPKTAAEAPVTHSSEEAELINVIIMLWTHTLMTCAMGANIQR